jgi:hypothetical protein
MAPSWSFVSRAASRTLTTNQPSITGREPGVQLFKSCFLDHFRSSPRDALPPEFTSSLERRPLAVSGILSPWRQLSVELPL